MLLSDRDIIECVRTGFLEIEPFDGSSVQPASVDVRLGEQFASFLDGDDFYGALDPENPEEMHPTVESEGFEMAPGAFVLGHTVEKIVLPAYIAARFEGKSSLGRLGLMTHVTAGFIDPGFRGQITVELHNVGNRSVILRPGMPIGQLCFFELSSCSERLYGSEGLGSKYQGQMGATGARTDPGL